MCVRMFGMKDLILTAGEWMNEGAAGDSGEKERFRRIILSEQCLIKLGRALALIDGNIF